MPPVKTKNVNGQVKKQEDKKEASKVSAGKGAPKLTNRGAAGLITKLSDKDKEALGGGKVTLSDAASDPFKLKGCRIKNRIAPSLVELAVPIESLTPDPDNARIHPDRNMASIILSLYNHGQLKPVVVRKQTGVVAAGNGTLEAAKRLGWKSIAANIVEMTEAEAAAYGLADNRTAELAKWDMETVARLDKLITEAGLDMPGWSIDELEVLRAAEWIPPTIEEGGFGEGGHADDPLLVSFDADQYEVVGPTIHKVRELQGNPDLSQAECLRLICGEWAKAERLGILNDLDDMEEDNAADRDEGESEEGSESADGDYPPE